MNHYDARDIALQACAELEELSQGSSIENGALKMLLRRIHTDVSKIRWHLEDLNDYEEKYKVALAQRNDLMKKVEELNREITNFKTSPDRLNKALEIAKDYSTHFIDMGTESRNQIVTNVLAGFWIQAIKDYRSWSGNGLKESKDFIEGLRDRLVTAQLLDYPKPATW